MIEYVAECSIGQFASWTAVALIVGRVVLAVLVYRVRSRIVSALHNIQPMEASTPASLGTLQEEDVPSEDHEISLDESPSGDD